MVVPAAALYFVAGASPRHAHERLGPAHKSSQSCGNFGEILRLDERSMKHRKLIEWALALALAGLLMALAAR
jgi:hypothetical protein